MKANWRRRSDVEPLRFIVALLAAPMLPAILVVSWFNKEIVPPRELPVLGTWVAWFFALGLLFDFSVARHRHKIRWGDCAILGMVAGATWPSVLIFLSAVLPNAVVLHLGLAYLRVPFAGLVVVLLNPTLLLATAYTTVHGLIAGNVLWRMGVEPAPPPVGMDEAFR